MTPDIIYTEIRCQSCKTAIKPEAAVIFVIIRPEGHLVTATCKNTMICAENSRDRPAG